MMNIIYKKLTEKELDIFISMRINQLREEGATEDIDLTPALKDYYKKHMEVTESTIKDANAFYEAFVATVQEAMKKDD